MTIGSLVALAAALLCAQFVIARDGAIYQLAPVTFMCRHTVGR